MKKTKRKKRLDEFVKYSTDLFTKASAPIKRMGIVYRDKEGKEFIRCSSKNWEFVYDNLVSCMCMNLKLGDKEFETTSTITKKITLGYDLWNELEKHHQEISKGKICREIKAVGIAYKTGRGEVIRYSARNWKWMGGSEVGDRLIPDWEKQHKALMKGKKQEPKQYKPAFVVIEKG